MLSDKTDPDQLPGVGNQKIIDDEAQKNKKYAWNLLL
jgi:hypothetical protein